MDVALLITEIKQGSTAAQKCLFDLYSDRMLLLCRRYLKSHEDAEEAMLDGFCRFFKKINSFTYKGEGAAEALLRQIMINECLMVLRKKNAFQLVSESAAEDIPFAEEAFSRLSAAEIFNLIVQLPLGYRTVFNLYVIEGMGHKEIAGLMKISEGTSKSQLSKAKAMLQKTLLLNGIEYAGTKSK